MCVQLLSTAVLFLCGSVVGAFHKVLMEKTLRQTFKDTLRCLSMRMKLEIEKRQQVSGSRRLVSHRDDAKQLQPAQMKILYYSLCMTAHFIFYLSFSL